VTTCADFTAAFSEARSAMDDPEQLRASEDLCRFLSACYCEPDPAFAEERLFDSMLEAARRIDAELGEQARRLGVAFVAQDLQTLLVDYTRLFIGPVDPRARPYAACWLPGEQDAAQDATSATLALYREGGFEPDEAVHEAPDHVAVALEFLYLLTFSRDRAAQAHDLPELARADALRRRFLADLLAWIGPFAAAVASGAQTPFYRQLGEMTQRFVRIEADRAGLR
jgi:putative dimethyl sulfoxide reductase chaperone